MMLDKEPEKRLEQVPPPVRTGLSTGKVIGLVLVCMLLTMAGTLLVVRFWLFPQPFQPVVLDRGEQQQLERKLDRFERIGTTGSRSGAAARTDRTGRTAQEAAEIAEDLRPEPYAEDADSRDLRFTEREINALIAANADLAQRVAVDLDDDLVSVKLRVPLDPDFPIFGGKVLRVRGGAELAFRDGRPVVILRGISLMGVPIPNAWLGGIKNIDLVQTFGGEPGFWQGFAEGVASIEVREGQLRIALRE
ncbi:MAG: arginine N-succinyltransferase [Desulfobulbus sp.]